MTHKDIYPSNEFNAILKRERFRSERTGCDFTVMTFKLMNQQSASIRILTKELTQRLRCYDDIGLINGNCLAVILPGTPVAAANKLAENVCNAVACRRLSIRYKTFLYPNDWNNINEKALCDFFEPDNQHKLQDKSLRPFSQILKPLWNGIFGIIILCKSFFSFGDRL